ncbi:hypothetical protein [Marinobacter sp. UBA3607]|uniref:hypothetical protein n=1 Tax=Marinobacter sp. UBA3607 TaxID=1946820 RepID=UPI000E8EBA40|nr:hypothetical protein [Marinobacter sp. UBA3607]HBM48950.1 hypothetical protein [Marinobacter sp.]
MTVYPEGQRDGVWAHPYQLASGQTQQHRLGHTHLWVTLLDQEWQVRFVVQQPEDSADPLTWFETIGHSLPSSEIPVQRFVRSGDNGEVCFIPAMASLPTVIRPSQPLTVPAGGRCVLYVGTNLWMKVCVGEGRSELTEVPLAVPSRTWLGRNSMEGEICYASSTYGRLALEAVPKRPWRAVTPVTIINRRERPLLLERFSLPTPLLSVYRNGQGLLWTPGITVECETDMNSASLRIDQSAPQAAGECELLAPAREKLAKGRRLVRAFDHIFG